MDKVFYRVFVSKASEEKWLNKMGQQGYLLKQKNKFKYILTCEKEKQYFYSVEYIDMSPFSSEADEYIKSREKDGEYVVAVSGRWIYFRKASSRIILSSRARQMNRVVYFWRSLYLYFFAICGVVVCGYQAFAVKFLERASLETSGKIREFLPVEATNNFFLAILNLFKRLINAFLELINVYLTFIGNLFGESDAVSVIALLAPITLILIILASINLDEYIQNKIGVKKNAK